jgi:3-deoxy-D-manno-octulosonate 8-phosphate phosphatase (KDO 8-P phosphatase)
MMERNLRERCAGIDMLILDVDGVLTAGGIIYADDAVEVKAFHVRDGAGLALWHEAGKKSAIITGRDSRAVKRRALELKVAFLIEGAARKLPAYRQLLEESRLRPEQVGVVADDLAEIPMLSDCGLAVAVADACPEVRWRAHYVTTSRGGHGAVRETIELILRCQGQWPIVD